MVCSLRRHALAMLRSAQELDTPGVLRHKKAVARSIKPTAMMALAAIKCHREGGATAATHDRSNAWRLKS